MRKRRVVSILIIALLIVAALSSLLDFSLQPSIDNAPNFLSSGGCELPCWEGIVPGRSTELEALKLVLTSIRLFDSPKYLREDWLFFQTERGDKVSVFFVDAHVQRLEVNPKTQVQLGTILYALGEPTQLTIHLDGEHEVCHIADLFYPETGILVEAGSCKDFSHGSDFEGGNVLSDTPVLKISFTEVFSDAPAMLRSLSTNEGELKDSETRMFHWIGYGYYPP